MGFILLLFAVAIVLFFAFFGAPILAIFGVAALSPFQIFLVVVALLFVFCLCVPRIVRAVRRRRLAKEQLLPLARVIRLKRD